MELIIGSLVALLTEASKYLTEKLNKELAKSIIILITLGLSILGGAIYYYIKDTLSESSLEGIVAIWGTSMLFYQIIIKKLITPLLNK